MRGRTRSSQIVRLGLKNATEKTHEYLEEIGKICYESTQEIVILRKFCQNSQQGKWQLDPHFKLM